MPISDQMIYRCNSREVDCRYGTHAQTLGEAGFRYLASVFLLVPERVQQLADWLIP